MSVAEAQEGQSAEVSAAVEAIVAELGGATSRRTGEEAPYDWERAGGYVHLAAGGGEAGGSGERSRHVIGILAKRLDRVNTERQLKELDTFIPDDFKAEVSWCLKDHLAWTSMGSGRGACQQYEARPTL